jgi:iron complex outermembrane receptor protein
LRLGGNDDVYGTEAGLPSVKNDIYDANETLVYHQGDQLPTFKRNVTYNDPHDYLIHENWNASLKYKHKLSEKSDIQFHASYAHDIIDYFSTEALRYLVDTNAIYDHYYMNGEKKTYICLDTLQRTGPFRFSHHTNTYQNYLDFTTSFETGSVVHQFLGGYYLMFIDRTTYTGYKAGDITGDGLYAKISVVNPILNQGDLQTKFSGARNYDELINSIYVQDFLNISDKLKALLALRFDYYHMVRHNAIVESGFTQTEPDKKYTQNSPALTYRAGLVYKPVSSFSVYTSYSTFFKPNRNTYVGDYIYLNNKGEEFSLSEGGEFFEPMKGYQIEGGVKYSLNNMLDISTSAFYIEQKNIVEKLGENEDGKKIRGQVGLIGSKGMEIEARANPFRGLSVIAGYGYTHAAYLEYAKNEYSKNSLVGNFMTQSPMNTAYGWCYYKVPKGTLKNLRLGLGANYRDVIYTNSSNIYSLPAYWLLDANVGYSIEKIYLKFGVYNMLDKEYYSNYIMSTQYIPGPERNYKFTIGIKL